MKINRTEILFKSMGLTECKTCKSELLEEGQACAFLCECGSGAFVEECPQCDSDVHSGSYQKGD